MDNSVFEKHAEYNGVKTHIRIPNEPLGVVFIAPGALVKTDTPLVQSIQKTCEEEGYATVVADLSKTPLNDDDLYNVHKFFTRDLSAVIDQAMTDNDFGTDAYDLIAHSMGGAAALTLASDNHDLSRLIVLDPTPVEDKIAGGIIADTHIITSAVRSFKTAGSNLHDRLPPEIFKTLHIIQTEKDRSSGHMFEGKLDELSKRIRETLHDDTPDFTPPESSPDLG